MKAQGGRKLSWNNKENRAEKADIAGLFLVTGKNLEKFCVPIF